MTEPLTPEEIEAFRGELAGFPERALEDQVDIDYLKRLLATLEAANPAPAGLDVERLERIARSALAAPPQIGRIAETLEPDPVYVAAREVVASYQRRPYCGTDTSRAIKELAAALANTKEPDGE